MPLSSPLLTLCARRAGGFRSRRVPALRVVFALAAVLFLGGGACACRRDVPDGVLPGVRLGMAPRDVRDRFEVGAPGTWQTRVASGPGGSDDTVLEWNATGPGGRATHARFEFHLGMLVAIRAQLRDPVASARVDLTPKTVMNRVPQGDGTALTILARDCPTHHDEAESLAVRAR